MYKEKILLTGATGYIGSFLAKKLYMLNYDVHILVRESSKLDSISEIEKNISLYVFNGDTIELNNILKNIKPDIVINLASLYLGSHASNQLIDLINSNVVFPTQLIEASINAKVNCFINTGTHWQNYNDCNYNPVNLYAATKEAFESISKYYIEVSNMRMITLKLIDTYGPYDFRPKVINLLKKIAISGENLEMSGGEQELGLVYIDDVIKAYLIAIETIQKLKSKEYKQFLVLPKKIYKLKEVIEIFQSVIGKKLNIELGKLPYKDREMMKVYTNGENILKNVSTMDLYEGISLMMNIEKNSDVKRG
ncbi:MULTISPECIES: NAD-dependent epimerase/dehydratase family protein [unclassified Clostridioides]|uniref:NAD-dependent epimerase/dehydratase family protein n=1 Tax=unclassified Clostridioides TaxID=2635829 RepID=UPI001D1126D3|nr:NAD-dependent epimerase/dehydratase family protein [Clostridioides sp. ES-S-0171-01]MCC0688040.1 NAD-dependent epimerase/dehydratase family protein [Clostridioides sp. ES-S-0056-01]MCC0715255.1 NAD-dependent epimerase/dehydratase family protein [Clostridioides sp. ES-S-0077-01]UDN54955.1 NAD-dependent epimerase/dehydratase family protein [Clostridioides sp. ES-S-0054-01]